MKKIYTDTFKSELGELTIASFEDKLCLCDWTYRKSRSQIDDRIKRGLGAEFVDKPSGINELTKVQLTEYFSGERKSFDIPYILNGSAFQIKVWEMLTEIPFGQTQSYKDLSLKLGDEKKIRAVASANGANALAIIIPCHRIVGSDGSMIGYAGGIRTKEKLLQLEGAIRDSNQLDLFGE